MINPASFDESIRQSNQPLTYGITLCEHNHEKTVRSPIAQRDEYLFL